jgi:hypothetical protein
MAASDSSRALSPVAAVGAAWVNALPSGSRFERRGPGKNPGMTVAVVILVVVVVATTAAYLGLLIWGAIEDGRDQHRREREHDGLDGR